MRPILILISHNHEFAIAEGSKVSWLVVLLGVVETQDLDHICDLLITHDLCVCVCVCV